MGRKRIDENEKKISISIGIKKKYVDYMKEKGINISELINDLLKKYFRF